MSEDTTPTLPANSQQPRPGCYDREPYKDTLTVLDGFYDTPDVPQSVDVGQAGTRVYRTKIIDFPNSRECHIADDPRCGDCIWRPTEGAT